MSCFLTIFTPTYNREKLLSDLWHSLCRQRNKNFIWLIIDDGSIDHTHELINSWQAISDFKIRYIYQANSGKHVAHNSAVELCTTPLFMCVDSDDILTEDAVSLIESYYQADKKQDNLIGWCARKGDLEGNPIHDKNWPQGEPELSCVELFEGLHFRGETALIWRTDVLKQYRFPVVDNEKFVTEQVLYYQISFIDKLKLKNDIFYLFEYRDDGYTKQGIRLNIKNPIGTAIAYKVQYIAAGSLFCRLKKLLKYKAWCQYFKISDLEIRKYFENMKYDHALFHVNWLMNIVLNFVVYIGKPVVKWKLKH